jgi:hypothetical protein
MGPIKAVAKALPLHVEPLIEGQPAVRASTHHLAPARPAARPAALSPASPTARSTANAEETLIIQPGRGLHVSIDAATTMHTHHAFKLVIPLEGGHLSLGQRVNAGVKFGAMPVLVAPDETQWMRVDGACMALFIQPESLGTIPTRWRLNHGPLAQALSGALAQQVSALGARWLRSDHTHDAAAGILADALDLLHRNDILRPSPLDPRIARALTLIDAAPAARWPLSVLAAAAKWSPTWFARPLPRGGRHAAAPLPAVAAPARRRLPVSNRRAAHPQHRRRRPARWLQRPRTPDPHRAPYARARPQ